MSTHTFPGVPLLPGALYLEVVRLIRTPTSVSGDASSSTYTFTPDLTAAELQTLADIQAAILTRNVTLTVEEYAAIRPDIAGLRTYAGIASPTLAQTVSAVKAQSRILRALLRD